MRVVIASIIGLCFMISSVWAVEVAPAPVTQGNQTAQPQGTAVAAPTPCLRRNLPLFLP